MKRRRVGVSAGVFIAIIVLLVGYFGSRNSKAPEYDQLPSYEPSVTPSFGDTADVQLAVQFMTVPDTNTADLIPHLPEQLLPEYMDATFTTETFGSGTQKRGGRRVIANNETDAVIAYTYNDGDDVQVIYIYCLTEELEQTRENLKKFLETY